MIPTRVQRKRTKGWKKPSNTVYVGRGSKYGNPFKIGFHMNHDIARIVDPEILDRGVMVNDAEHAKELYRIWTVGDYSGTLGEAAKKHFELIGLPIIQKDLKGKNLMCWCKIGDACHADILLELANKE